MYLLFIRIVCIFVLLGVNWIIKIVFILGVILCLILCGLIILKYGELVWVILIRRVI